MGLVVAMPYTHSTASTSCFGKKCYRTWDAADRDARSLQRESHWPFAAYRCRWCGGWHVGHAQKRREKRTQGMGQRCVNY